MRKAIAAVVLVAAGFLVAHTVESAYDSPAQLTEAKLVQELKARGWQSDPTDGREALYAN